MNELKNFGDLLKESNVFPKNELRDYYLVPQKTLFCSNHQIAEEVFDDQTAIMMLTEELLKPKINPIREINLSTLLMDVIEKTPIKLLNYQNKDGNNVIHLTTKIENFSVSILDYFKECGTSFSLLNKNKETALMLISHSNSLDDLKFIHAYTDINLINQQDKNGETALFRAVKSKNLNNVFFLLDIGSNVLIKNKDNESVIDIYKKESFKKKCDEITYKELGEILKLFSIKQKTEDSIKKMSNNN